MNVYFKCKLKSLKRKVGWEKNIIHTKKNTVVKIHLFYMDSVIKLLAVSMKLIQIYYQLIIGN